MFTMFVFSLLVCLYLQYSAKHKVQLRLMGMSLVLPVICHQQNKKNAVIMAQEEESGAHQSY